MDLAQLPFVSIVVPTRDRAALLAGCLTSLATQSYPADRFEIIVADDGSRDSTARTVAAVGESTEGRPLVRYLGLARRGPNEARNAGVAVASGDPVCFVDDDEDVPPAWLAAMVAGVQAHPTAACLGGPMWLRLEGRPPRMCGCAPLGESELDFGRVDHEVEVVWGGNMAIRRFALDAVGPFRESGALGHNETEWMGRLRAMHYPVHYIADAGLWHRRTASQLTLRSLVQRRFTRGVGQARMEHLRGESYGVREQLDGIGRDVVHALGKRCAVGWLHAALVLGRSVGTLETRVKTRLPRSAR